MSSENEQKMTRRLEVAEPKIKEIVEEIRKFINNGHYGEMTISFQAGDIKSFVSAPRKKFR